ncbi:hypothetical protein [Salinigranum rubrum]|uniref:hypothetical protein n=1 Tax=Salinigranum rubrum TaxID=755307 RepID=UPI001FED0F98|nr:hypothetical protein [Salinigranum rubrum]
MKSAEHATIGALVGVVAVALLFGGESLPAQAALWVAGVFLSVFVDLDHFLIARVMRGDWSNLRRAVTNPRVGLVDQERVFADVDEPRLRQYRLLSHLVVGACSSHSLSGSTDEWLSSSPCSSTSTWSRTSSATPSWRERRWLTAGTVPFVRRRPGQPLPAARP